MAYTEKELKFIDDNSQLIELGNFKELADKMEEDLVGFERRRMHYLLVYLLFGTKSFKASLSVESPSIVLGGAVINLTSYKAKGSPLLPSNFTAKSRMVLYKIEKGKVVKSEKYRLSTRSDLNDTMAKNGYNLCIFDKPEYTSIVDGLGGEFVYNLSLDYVYNPNYLYSRMASVSAIAKSTEEAKDKLGSALLKSLGSTYGEDLSKVNQEVTDYIIDNLDFSKVV